MGKEMDIAGVVADNISDTGRGGGRYVLPFLLLLQKRHPLIKLELLLASACKPKQHITHSKAAVGTKGRVHFTRGGGAVVGPP